MGRESVEGVRCACAGAGGGGEKMEGGLGRGFGAWGVSEESKVYVCVWVSGGGGGRERGEKRKEDVGGGGCIGSHWNRVRCTCV